MLSGHKLELLTPKGEEMIKNFFKDETGLELSEYAVATALVVAAVVAAFGLLGDAINNRIRTMTDTIETGNA